MIFRIISLYIFFLLIYQIANAQNASLSFFLDAAKQNDPSLLENKNLQKAGDIHNEIIQAQNSALQVNATSEVMISPYYNNNGKVIDVTTMPDPNAWGYDVGITNGGFYSAQINLTKNLLNKGIVDHLLFQNQVKSQGIAIAEEDLERTLIKNITDAYVMAYQLQLQSNFTKDILKDLQKRLEVMELIVKRGILQESDYLLLQLDIESKTLELDQIENNFKVAINQLYSLSGMKSQVLEKLDRPTIPNSSFSNNEKHFYQRKFINDSLQLIADQLVFDNNYKPQLSAYGNTGLNAIEIPNIRRRIGMSAGLRLTIPIYDGKQRLFNKKQNKLKEENLEYYRDNAAVQLENNLDVLQYQMTALEQNQKLLDRQIRKQENVLELYKGKMIQGQVSIVDYLNVIQNYKQNIYTKLQMQTNTWLLQSQYNFINW